MVSSNLQVAARSPHTAGCGTKPPKRACQLNLAGTHAGQTLHSRTAEAWASSLLILPHCKSHSMACCCSSPAAGQAFRCGQCMRTAWAHTMQDSAGCSSESEPLPSESQQQHLPGATPLPRVPTGPAEMTAYNWSVRLLGLTPSVGAGNSSNSMLAISEPTTRG